MLRLEGATFLFHVSLKLPGALVVSVVGPFIALAVVLAGAGALAMAWLDRRRALQPA